MSALLSVVHGLDYALSSWLVGLVVFNFFILPAGGPAAQNLLADFSKRLRVLSLLTLISSSFWMLLSIEDMTESWVPSELWAAMSGTSFGHLWCARITTLMILVFIGSRLSKHRSRSFSILILSLLLPLLSVLSGHAGSQVDHLALRVSAGWVHAVAVGIWSGGLYLLYVWLGKRLAEKRFEANTCRRVVGRFSHFAMVSTAIILLTGLLTAGLNGVPIFAPWTSLYGRLILVKLLFFGTALLAASINQFVHIKKWRIENEIESVTLLRREVKLEFILLIVVFAAAGFLTRTALPEVISADVHSENALISAF